MRKHQYSRLYHAFITPGEQWRAWFAIASVLIWVACVFVLVLNDPSETLFFWLTMTLLTSNFLAIRAWWYPEREEEAMVMMTKEERRRSLTEREALIAEGKSWFKYVQKDFTAKGGITPDEAVDRENFFLALGLLGNAADLDIDDVDYPGEGTGDEHSD